MLPDDQPPTAPPTTPPPDPTLSAPPPDPPAASPATTAPTRRSWAMRSAPLAAIALVAGWAGGTLAAAGGTAESPPASATAEVDLVSVDGAIDVAAVLDHVEDAVVSVTTTVRTSRGPFQPTGEAAGTGIVIDDGLILTNAHVIDSGTDITVTGADGQEHAAELVASDDANDIAILSIADTDGLKIADLAATDTVSVGEPVVAIGNALALEGSMTVTEGIVSALNRSIDTTNGTINDLIQTDAAISSGNSGGPLVDANGQVIGITTAIASSSSSVEASNIGFAISADTALTVVDQLLAQAS